MECAWIRRHGLGKQKNCNGLGMVKNSKQTESFESHVTKATGTGKLIVSGFVGLRMDSASKLGITCSITNGSKRIYKLGIKRDAIVKTI